jgi:two-component system chemotaxis response regulator CheB
LQQYTKPAYIITVGASAGGLNAVNELIAQLPETLNVAVFIVMHLSKVGVGEFLVTRLQKYTAFTCIIPQDGDQIEAGKIYIAPPDKHLLIKDGKVALGYGPAENRWRPSIDVLFRSAAANYGNRVIGIILTGYLSDGTSGMVAIKKSNGCCIVQDPNQAEYPDMPLSVMEAMEVDFSARLDEMGEIIEAIVQKAQPETDEIDQDVLKEAQISENTVTSIAAVSTLGEKALYACPDCGGGLWDVEKNSTIKRFRCHIGHSYLENDLFIKQGHNVEATLWVALRMMEERKMLLMNIGAEEQNKGLPRLSRLHQQRANDLESHIRTLKELLFDTQKEKLAG